MDDEAIPTIAEKVSLLMQLDRMRHKVGTEVDMKALGNVPTYIASVFEKANELTGEISPSDFYHHVNKRLSQVQAQLYLMRLEMEDRYERDPSKVYNDPMAISAYGEYVPDRAPVLREFDFEPAILAHGWYPSELMNGAYHRWMRPGGSAIACLPHLGGVAQLITIHGSTISNEQLDGLTIAACGVNASINKKYDDSKGFSASLSLSADLLKSSNYIPIEFTMSDFKQPSTSDQRLLGVNINRFVLEPKADEQSERRGIL